jgi:hypothetical protein
MLVAPTAGAMSAPAPPILLIVSRHNSTLYSYACTEFEGLGTDIDVVLDRRRGERRRRVSGETESERRRGDRRAYAIEEDLRGIGWALVRRDAPYSGWRLASTGEPSA